MICKCCANFLLLIISPGDVLIDEFSESGWYVLYAPGGSNPQLIKHQTGDSLYAGYSTTKARECTDPQTHLVGACTSHIGCVEDSIASFGNGETESLAGFNILNNLTGRFKREVRDLYKQRECFAFIKHTGFFKDQNDVEDALLGKVMFRPIPTSKFIPAKTFGQPFEAVWVDNGRADVLSQSVDRLTILSLVDETIAAQERRISLEVAGTGSLRFIFSKVLLGEVSVSEGFTQELRGSILLVRSIPGTTTSTLIVSIRKTNPGVPFTIF